MIEYREATEQETEAWLSGYMSIEGAVETEHGVLVPITACGSIMPAGRHYGPDRCALWPGHAGWHAGERGSQWTE